jgi:hypothetical protein
VHVRAIGSEHRHADHTGVPAQLQHVPEQGGQRRLVALANDPELELSRRTTVMVATAPCPRWEVKQGGPVDVGHPVGPRGAEPPASETLAHPGDPRARRCRLAGIHAFDREIRRQPGVSHEPLDQLAAWLSGTPPRSRPIAWCRRASDGM